MKDKTKAVPAKETALNTVRPLAYQRHGDMSSQNKLEMAGLLMLGIAGGRIPHKPHVWRQVEDALRQHYRCGEGQP